MHLGHLSANLQRKLRRRRCRRRIFRSDCRGNQATAQGHGHAFQQPLKGLGEVAEKMKTIRHLQCIWGTFPRTFSVSSGAVAAEDESSAVTVEETRLRRKATATRSSN